MGWYKREQTTASTKRKGKDITTTIHWIAATVEGNRLKKGHQFYKGDEPVLSADGNKKEKVNTIKDFLQQRQYDMRLYKEYKDKINTQNKL